MARERFQENSIQPRNRLMPFLIIRPMGGVGQRAAGRDGRTGGHREGRAERGERRGERGERSGESAA
jgi:hypothetical protein